MKVFSLIRAGILVVTVSTLSGCSYAYDVIAERLNDHIVFRVAVNSPRHPTCVSRIEIRESDTNEIVWRDSVDQDDGCSNEFPMAYGSKFSGRSEPAWPRINAKTLTKEVVYEISTTTGATGYGGGIFMIDQSGQVLNGRELPTTTASDKAAIM